MSNSIIDFLLDGIVDVTLVIIPIHLIYYHTAHPVTGLFDFQAPVVQTLDSAIQRLNNQGQMSHKALSKWKFAGRCFGFDEVFEL